MSLYILQTVTQVTRHFLHNSTFFRECPRLHSKEPQITHSDPDSAPTAECSSLSPWSPARHVCQNPLQHPKWASDGALCITLFRSCVPGDAAAANNYGPPSVLPSASDPECPKWFRPQGAGHPPGHPEAALVPRAPSLQRRCLPHGGITPAPYPRPPTTPRRYCFVHCWDSVYA